MTAPTVEFFWDAISPYAYLASTQIERVAEKTGAQLVWKPFLLGGVFQATGNTPPIGVPAKGRHLADDLQRWAKHYGVPVTSPKNFPINSLLPQRVACAVPEGPKSAEFAKAVMLATWGEGRDTGKPDELTRVVTSIGLDAPALLARAQEQPVKDRLRAFTDEAVKRGAFGAPTFFVGNALFWGNDRLGLLEDHLRASAA
jgi:2-hydroxychromene-2-carboxylate isomerase